jgi:AsmA protein
MKKLAYITGGLVLIVVAVFAVAAIILATVNPDNYKDEIAQFAQNATGRQLTLGGPVSLSFFPVLGFTVSDVQISNPPNFQGAPLADIAELQAGVEILPLLGGNIRFNTIRAVNPDITILRKTNGETNLGFSQSAQTRENTGGSNSFTFRADDIEISGGSVRYKDMASNEAYLIENLNFSMSSLLFGESVEATLSGIMSGPAMRTDFDARANIVIGDTLSVIDINDVEIHLRATESETSLNIRGNMQVDLQSQRLSFENITLESVGTMAQAGGAYEWGSNPALQFDLISEKIDVDHIMASFGGAEKPQDTSAPFDFNMPVEFMRGLDVNADINIGTLSMMNLDITDLALAARTQNNQIVFNPVTFDFYGGQYDGRTTLDPSGSVLTVSEKGTLENVNLGEALQAWFGRDVLSGTATITYNLRSAGNSFQTQIGNLGGTASFTMGEGEIQYGPIATRLNQALAFFEQQEMLENPDEYLNFLSLEGTLTGNSGVFQNNDLVLIIPRSHALGMGQINLASSSIDYTLRAGLGISEDSFSNALHLPIRIYGPLSDPSYGLDVDYLIENRTGELIEETSGELVEKAMDAIGIAGEADNAQDLEPASGDGEPVQEFLGDLLGVE